MKHFIAEDAAHRRLRLGDRRSGFEPADNRYGILADEVGLGKTIEAGLVIAQLLAEGTLNELRLKSGRRDSTLEDVFLHLVAQTAPRAA